MAAKDLLLDFAEYDLHRVVAGIDEIRRYNPQRYEVEQLTAIVFEDLSRHVVVGYHDVAADAFWVRGHMPGMPLMPGVLMCEAAAQLCSYFCCKHDLLGSRMIGFGGLDEVRFRDPVFPGQRLVIVSKMEKLRRGAMVISRFQSFVDQNLVCEGLIRGVPLPEGRLQAAVKA